MIDQRRKHVSYGSSFKDFFKGFVDFTGYTSVSGHWFPVGSILGGLILLTIIVFQGMFSSFTSISRKSTRSADYLLGGGALSDGVSTLQTGLAFGIFIIIAGLILILPLTASFARRLRDVGFATWGIVILIALYYILSFFSVYLLTPVYAIVFFFVLMSLPSNAVETNSNSEFARFFLRQTPQAQQYYSQFASPFGQPVQYDQFGNPIPNQPYFNNSMNQGFQGQPQGFNPNVPQGHPQQGFQGQPQGFNPNVPQGRPQQGFQGQSQSFNPNAPQGRPQQGFQGQPQGFNPNAPQGRSQQGFQGQSQGFNPNAPHGGRPQQGFQGQPQGFNPNTPQGHPQQGFQGQPQGFNLNAQHGGQAPQGFNPNVQHGGQPQGFNPNAQHGGQVPQGFNPNAQHGVQEQVAVNEVQEERPVQASQEVHIAPEQHVEVAPQVETAPVVKTPAPQVEETHQTETVAVAGGARSRRLQKLNKVEEEVAFKKRR